MSDQEQEPSRTFTLRMSESAGNRVEEMAHRKGVAVDELFRLSLASMAMVDKLIEEGRLHISEFDELTDPNTPND